MRGWVGQPGLARASNNPPSPPTLRPQLLTSKQTKRGDYGPSLSLDMGLGW